MNNRYVIFLVFSILLTGVTDVLSQQPNVLFIAIDDLNTSPAIMDGETSIETPNLEALSKRGVLFTNAHCAAPACNPSRTAVMTGLAPSTSGVYTNGQDWRENSILKDHTTLPEFFKKAGYKTLGGGKLYHAASLSQKGYTGFLDPEPWYEYFPSKTRQMPQEVLPDSIPMHSSKNFYGGRFDWAALDIEPEEMADAKVVEWAEKQLLMEHDQPLFLAVGIYRPHIPWYTPVKYFDQYPLESLSMPEILEDDLEDVPQAGKNKLKISWHQWILEHDQWESFVRAYYASVSFTDDMIGRLLAALDDGPLSDNTIIILWSDHGYHLGQKQHWEKFALWEQTTRVPFIVAGQGIKKRGKVSKEAVSLLDIYPTLVDLCGLEVEYDLDGRSLIPLLEHPGKRTGRAIVTTHGKENHAVRSRRWRYIKYADGSEELYDQKRDPKNFHNLIGSSKSHKVIMDIEHFLPEANAERNPAPSVNPLGDKQNRKL